MTKLFKAFGVLCVVLFAAYFFLIDNLIKAQLEREGALALQAPLAIGKVNFHLLPTALTLRDVQIGNPSLPARNLVQAEEISLPLTLRDLLAHKIIIDTLDIHSLRFNRLRAGQTDTANTQRATTSPQLRAALQRIQEMVNHPLASNTIDPNASIAGAILADQFKPLLTQITMALNALATSSNSGGEWQIFVRRANIDGAFDFGARFPNNNNESSDSGALQFAGTIDNMTPQPQLFDAVTQLDMHNQKGAPATLHVSGRIDRRKLVQASLRFDLDGFPLAQWPLCDDPDLKIVVISARASIQALLTLTGNQFDLNALAHFQQARVEVANGNNEIARVVAEVWRHTDAFDLNLQAAGDLQNPILKLNSSLDAPLAAAIRQLQSVPAFPQAASFSNSP